MKHNQAWGWLLAAVMAAGLNASYHNGDLRWAHSFAQQVGHSTGAVLALASGHADRFLTEARFLTASEPSGPPCPLAQKMAEIRVHIPAYFSQTSAVADRIQARNNEISARNLGRNEVRLAKLQAQRDRMQAQRDRMQAEIQVRAARFEMTTANFDHAAFRSVSENFNPISADQLKHLACLREHSRVRVSIPQIPAVQVSEIHVEAAVENSF